MRAQWDGRPRNSLHSRQGPAAGQVMPGGREGGREGDTTLQEPVPHLPGVKRACTSDSISQPHVWGSTWSGLALHPVHLCSTTIEPRWHLQPTQGVLCRSQVAESSAVSHHPRCAAASPPAYPPPTASFGRCLLLQLRLPLLPRSQLQQEKIVVYALQCVVAPRAPFRPFCLLEL